MKDYEDTSFIIDENSAKDMIEGFLGKITRQMLRDIRVVITQELIDWIYKCFDEVNETPVVYHWKYKMEDFGSLFDVAN